MSGSVPRPGSETTTAPDRIASVTRRCSKYGRSLTWTLRSTRVRSSRARLPGPLRKPGDPAGCGRPVSTMTSLHGRRASTGAYEASSRLRQTPRAEEGHVDVPLEVEAGAAHRAV